MILDYRKKKQKNGQISTKFMHISKQFNSIFCLKPTNLLRRVGFPVIASNKCEMQATISLLHFHVEFFFVFGFTIVRWNETVCYSFDSVDENFYRVFKGNEPTQAVNTVAIVGVGEFITCISIVARSCALRPYDPYQNSKKKNPFFYFSRDKSSSFGDGFRFLVSFVLLLGFDYAIQT